MEYTSQFNAMSWIGFIPPIMFVGCLYFSLMYFQHLKNGEERKIKQSRIAAVICLAVALLVPALFNFYILKQMMQ